MLSSDFSNSQRKRVLILGSTGSIGTQTLQVIQKHSDMLEVCGISANKNVTLALKQAKDFNVSHIAFGCENVCESAQNEIAILREICKSVQFGSRAIVDLINTTKPDIVMNALVGFSGLEASIQTLKSGAVLALANKESLVVGGDLIMPLVKDGNMLPVDSEHGAIFQCLIGEKSKEISKLWITASGGPFLGKTVNELQDIQPKDALAHPNWDMGQKISIDSSTLMNKGLEVIEAHHLFNLPYDQIEVVVQKQSVIHSMVEFCDASVKAHLGTTDMRIPIQYALSYPDRWDAPVAPLDFLSLGRLDFQVPDLKNFECLSLAIMAGKTGGTMPCVLNAANEIAVAAFLSNKCKYLDISRCVKATMAAHLPENVCSVVQLIEVDRWARDFASRNLMI